MLCSIRSDIKENRDYFAESSRNQEAASWLCPGVTEMKVKGGALHIEGGNSFLPQETDEIKWFKWEKYPIE